MSIAQQEFTDAGKSMLGRAQAGEILTISKMVVGSGTVAAASDLWPLTNLVNFVMNVNLSSKRDYGDGTMLVEGSFRSDQAPAPFDLREVGIMAHVGAEADRLYSVANVLGDPPDHIDPASPSVVAFKVKLVIDRIPTDSLAISIGPTEAITGENIGADTVGEGVYKEAVGNVMRFKRIKAGASIVITEDVSGDFFTIGMQIPATNLNLYVPANHPNAPSPDVAFATVQAALAYLDNYFIPANKVATIHIWKGTYPITPVIVSHSNQSQIYITGEPRVDHTIVSVTSLDATHKNVQLSGDISDLVVGMRVYLANVMTGWSGGAKITAKAGAVVTLTVEKADSQPNFVTTDSSSSGRRLSYFPTVLTQSDSSKVTFASKDLGGISAITLDGGLHGLHLEGFTRVTNVHIYNAGTGIAGTDMVLYGEIVLTKCAFGMTGDNVTVQAAELYINACTMGAAATTLYLGAQNGSQTNKVRFAHCATGVRNWSAKAVLGLLAASSNDYVVDIEFGGTCIINPAPGLISTFDNNGTAFYAYGMSYIQYNRNGQSSPSSNPAAETIGNQNSLIHMAA